LQKIPVSLQNCIRVCSATQITPWTSANATAQTCTNTVLTHKLKKGTVKSTAIKCSEIKSNTRRAA
jgi:hypothetical protein